MRLRYASRREFLLLAGGITAMGAEKVKDRGGPVIVLAGRRVDAPDASVPRFPAANRAVVQSRLRQLFVRQKPVALVCAAACGADLIALQTAGELGIERHIILPSPAEVFKRTSVVDRPGDWGEVFDAVIKEVGKVEVSDVPDGQAGYLETNLKLLDRAQSLAATKRRKVAAVVVWDGKSRGDDDVTGHLKAQAESRGIPVSVVLTM